MSPDLNFALCDLEPKLLHPTQTVCPHLGSEAIIHTSGVLRSVVRSPQSRHTRPRRAQGSRGALRRQDASEPKSPSPVGQGQGRGGAPREAASQIVRQGSRLPVSLPLLVCGPLLTQEKREGKGRRKGQKHSSSGALCPETSWRMPETVPHTEYVEPLSGLKEIYYCLPNSFFCEKWVSAPLNETC